MEKHENEIELIDILNVIWKRKWLIIIPTLLLAISVGIFSFILPEKWEIDTLIVPGKFTLQTEGASLIVPGKFTLQTEGGSYEEVLVTDPIQIADQINQASYDHSIASELNLDIREFPKLKAEHIRDTNLVRISIKASDIEKAKSILSSLYKHLQSELDKKIDVEIKGIDTKIATSENLIKHKNLTIKDNQQEISTAKNKLKISEDRTVSITEEMTSVKKRIDELDEQLKNALSKEKEKIEAISLLLYSNEIQNNLRYYNTLDEKLSNEKIIQENLNLIQHNKKNEIDKIKNEIEDVKNQIDLLTERKTRIDYTRLVKEPTSSLRPVSPNKKLNILIAGFIGLIVFSLLAFLLEYIKIQHQYDIKVKDNG